MGLRCLSLMLLLISASAQADWRNDISPAVLSGQGDFSFWGFHLYTAQLWVPKLPFDMARPFALHLTYRRHISRDRLVSSGMDEMQRIQGKAWRDDKGEVWKRAMERAFVDVESGDTITGVFLPGFGARFYHNGIPTSEVADTEFAQAFFAIWLGPRTRAPELRAQLINQRAEN